MTKKELYNWFYENFDLSNNPVFPRIVLTPKTDIGKFLTEEDQGLQKSSELPFISSVGTSISAPIFEFIIKFYNVNQSTIWATLKIISKDFVK
jgi:hypothetical protein